MELLPGNIVTLRWGVGDDVTSSLSLCPDQP